MIGGERESLDDLCCSKKRRMLACGPARAGRVGCEASSEREGIARRLLPRCMATPGGSAGGEVRHHGASENSITPHTMAGRAAMPGTVRCSREAAGGQVAFIAKGDAGEEVAAMWPHR